MKKRNRACDEALFLMKKEITRYDDHHFILKTHVMASNQFFAWISAFRKKAKILSPWINDILSYLLFFLSSLNHIHESYDDI